MVRLYRDQTTKKKALIIGVAAELQLEAIFLISFLPMILFNPYPGGIQFPIILPIPVLILVGLAIIKIFPPHEVETWVDKDQSGGYWWEKTDASKGAEEATPMPAAKVATSNEPEDATTADALNEPAPEPEDDWLKEN